MCGSRRQPSYEHDSFWLMQLPAMLVVEIDGGQHVDARRYAPERTRVLEARGYRVLRFWNDEVLLRTEDVLEVIWRDLMGAKERS